MDEKFELKQCIYNDDKKRQQICDLIDETLMEEIFNNDDNKSSIGITISYLKKFIRIATVFKDKSFEEEREWRFVNKTGKTIESDIKYRKGKSMILPYVEIKIKNDLDLLVIDNILIGPTPHRQLSLNVVKSLLENKNSRAEVSLSKIPYRAW